MGLPEDKIIEINIVSQTNIVETHERHIHNTNICTSIEHTFYESLAKLCVIELKCSTINNLFSQNLSYMDPIEVKILFFKILKTLKSLKFHQILYTNMYC